MSNATVLLSTTEAAAYLGVKRQRILQLAAEGRIGHRIGSAWAFTRSELDEYRTQRRTGRPRLLADSGLGTGTNHAMQEHATLLARSPGSQLVHEVLHGDPPAQQPTAVPSVWAVATNKGGIGKTTLTVNLGAALAQRGWHVLLVDLDKQGHSGLHLGRAREQVARERSLAALVEKLPIAATIEETPVGGLDLLPMHPDMVYLEPQLGNLRLHWLRRALQLLPRERYDLVLLDTPPTGNLLTAALIAADRAIIPIIPEPLALEGLGDILASVQDVRETLDAGPERLYLVVNRWREQTKLARSIRDTLGQLRLPITTMATRISIDIALPEASGAQLPVSSYRPASRAAQQFSMLAEELMQHEEAV